MKKLVRRLVSVTAACAVFCTSVLSAPVSAAYNDFDYITNHVNLGQNQQLAITRPEKNITTASSAYLIMGTSTPGAAITVNGTPVTAVGSKGSFAAYLKLSPGANMFTFRQGGQAASVTITRNDNAVATTKVISSMFPTYDVAIPGGKAYNVTCTAPSGATVTAYIGSYAYQMKQVAATAVAGVPARFQVSVTPGAVSKTISLGKVTYVMQYNGQQKKFQSEGDLYIAGQNLLVQVKNSAAVLYQEAGLANYALDARKGAIGYVTAFGKNAYQLSFGAWIPRGSVDILTEGTAANNVTAMSLQPYKDGEALILQDSSNPFVSFSSKDNTLTVNLRSTTLSSRTIDFSQSKLFSGATTSSGSGNSQIALSLKNAGLLWGYDVRYENNLTVLYFKYKPALSGGNQPLSGVTVAVDAGHGGEDPGALGMTWTKGPDEADLNLATAIAVKKRLETLGASVILTRSDDSTMDMNDRMELSYAKDADFFISLHANSLGYTQNAPKATGTEVYYFYNKHKSLASTMSAYVGSYNGRTNRGSKFSTFRVTIQSYAPSVLVETGFMCNPGEFDTLTSKQGIFNTANAVGDGLVKYLYG